MKTQPLGIMLSCSSLYIRVYSFGMHNDATGDIYSTIFWRNVLQKNLRVNSLVCSTISKKVQMSSEWNKIQLCKETKKILLRYGQDCIFKFMVISSKIKTAIYFATHFCLLFFVALLVWYPEVQ